MPSLAIHVPFVRGQNEQVDRKLLPDGHFRAVYNMQLERDGRMARRRRLIPKTLLSADGSLLAESIIGGAAPNAALVRTEEGKVSTAGWAQGVDGNEQLRLTQGELGVISKVESFNSPHENVDENATYDSSESSETYYEQLYPQVDSDPDGRVVFAHRQGKHIVVTVRDPGTLRILFEIRKNLNIGSAGDYFKFKLAVSKVTNRIALLAAYLIPEIPVSQIAIYLFDSATGEELNSNGGVPLVTNPTTSLTGLGLDAMARPDVDSLMMAYDTATVGTFRLSEVSFATGSITETHDEVSSWTPYNWNGYPVFSLCVGTLSERWVWGISGANDVGPTLRTGMWGGGDVTTKEFTADDMPPGLALLDRDRIVVVIGALESLDRAFSSGFTKVTIWNHRNNTTSRLGNDNQTGGGGWMHHLYAGHPLVAGDGDAARIMFAAYSAGPYFQRKIEPSCGYINSITVEDEQLVVEAKLMEAGLEYRLWDGQGSTIAFSESGWKRGHLYEAGPARPLRYAHEGKDYIIWPLMQTSVARAQLGVDAQEKPAPLASWHRTLLGGPRKGLALRNNETLIPGGALRFFDGSGAGLAGYMGAPGIQFSFSELDDDFGDGLTQDVTLRFAVVLEFIDGNGRLWRSAPSAIDLNEIGTPTESFIYGWKFYLQAPVGQAGQLRGSQIVVYMSEEDGTVLYRRWVFAIEDGMTYTYDGPNVLAGFYIPTGIDDTVPFGAEVLYTQSGEVANDPPPCCEMLTATRSRVWAAGLPSKSWIQASKTLRDTMGVEWSNFDSFKIFMPDEVTGLAAMDDSVVAFTRTGVYVISGEGPDLTGSGTFFEPQLVPSSSGCIEHRSVISTEIGVFYQSRRGLELVPRGFGSPVWIGEPVRDTLENFPICKGACLSPADYTVRWLFNTVGDSASLVIVYDLRAKSWYVFGYERAFDGISLCTGRDGDAGHQAMMLFSANDVFVEDLTTDGQEGLASHEAYLETGDMRFAAIQGWASGRRVHILGQFGGRSCTVKLDFAFDGQRYLPQDTFSWELTEAEYGSGVPVELQLTLPVQLFSSIRFKITVLSADDSESSAYSYKPNGVTLYYTPHAEGPRLEARKTG